MDQATNLLSRFPRHGRFLDCDDEEELVRVFMKLLLNDPLLPFFTQYCALFSIPVMYGVKTYIYLKVKSSLRAVNIFALAWILSLILIYASLPWNGSNHSYMLSLVGGPISFLALPTFTFLWDALAKHPRYPALFIARTIGEILFFYPLWFWCTGYLYLVMDWVWI